MPKFSFQPARILAVAAVAVSLGALGVFVGGQLSAGGGAPTEPSPGVVYDTPVPLPDFTLADQTGQPYTFSASRGKVVLMAFLFTHCGDVCPFGAVKMRVALEQLGDRARDVELVVVSTDPERDTVPVIADYSRALGLYDRWHMVTGPLDTMTKLYQGLKITVIKDDEDESKAPGATNISVSLPQKDRVDSPLYGLTDEQVLTGDKVAKQFAGGYNVAHSAPFWVVDPDGNLRTSLDVSATPAQLVAAIKTYLKKS